MNALSPPSHFRRGERFDTLVTRAFADEPHRFTRDRLIADVDSGRHDGLLLRAAPGLSGLSREEERRAAINLIDYAFESLVMPTLSLEQLHGYCAAVEQSVRLGDASGLDRPGPLWVDTVHHACFASVLFRFAVNLRQMRPCDRVVFLYQGKPPEIRLGIIANLAAHLLGVQPVTLSMDGSWFRDLAGFATPLTLIFSMADRPVMTSTIPSRRRPAQIELHAGDGSRHRVDVAPGSAILARRLGANHLVLDYPQPDLIRLAPFDPDRPPTCPLVDWVRWPTIVANGLEPLADPAPDGDRPMSAPTPAAE